MNTAVSDYIENAELDHKEILINLRRIIFSTIKNANEQFKWSRPVYGLNKDFCYLKTTKKYVTIGFFDFEKIKTNTERIEGTGKSMRHIKIKNLEDLKLLKIEEILKEVVE